MKKLMHVKKEEQEIMPLFNGAFIENKPIPFPNFEGTIAYSNLFYWANLEAKETSEFPLHPHEGFEIMTFVFTGSVEHFDTATKVWTPLSEGGVQVIQAGSGVKHAERITKGTQLFQIWFDPDFSKSLKQNAQYKDYAGDCFKYEEVGGLERLSYLQEKGPIVSQTPGISIEKLSFKEGNYQEVLDEDFVYSCYLLKGRLDVDATELEKDDFLRVTEHKELKLVVYEDSELFVIKSPLEVTYDRFIQRY